MQIKCVVSEDIQCFEFAIHMNLTYSVVQKSEFTKMLKKKNIVTWSWNIDISEFNFIYIMLETSFFKSCIKLTRNKMKKNNFLIWMPLYVYGYLYLHLFSSSSFASISCLTFSSNFFSFFCRSLDCEHAEYTSEKSTKKLMPVVFPFY